MNSSTLATSFLHLKTPSFNPLPSLSHFTITLKPHNFPHIPPLKAVIRVSSNHTPKDTTTNNNNNNNNNNRRHTVPIIQNLKTVFKTAILIATTASLAAKFSLLPPAKAESPGTLTEQTPILEEQEETKEENKNKNQVEQSSLLGELLESNTEVIESLLQQKLENGEDEEALKILERLVSARPAVTEWKFLMARLLNEMGQIQNARNLLEEILAVNPFSFEALFENALLMDRCGEGEAVVRRLQEALDIAQEENKVKEARDVRLIMAQLQFLQKNVEEALKSYQELSKEDPSDFRPYFCRGMIYSLLDRNEEAREQFAKYRELSPKKFEVEGYLRTPLSRMKLFGSNEEK